tara:strand:- start:41 stop:316 length:276 start_codon:yes stop_codon:yes gene_type:complete
MKILTGGAPSCSADDGSFEFTYKLMSGYESENDEELAELIKQEVKQMNLKKEYTERWVFAALKDQTRNLEIEIFDAVAPNTYPCFSELKRA